MKLGDIIFSSKVIRAGKIGFPLLSMTMHGGLVAPEEKFKKRVASADTSAYKIVKYGQLVVGFPIDEGVLSFQTHYPEAIVSPAYNIWNVNTNLALHLPYLESFLRSPRALQFYKSNLRSTTARRRTLHDDIFLSLDVPLPDIEKQKKIFATLDKADAIRRKRQQSLELADSLLKSVFLDMFGDPVTNPKGWGKGTIRDIVSDVSYGTSKPAANGGKYIYLRMNNITYSGSLDLTNVKHINATDSDLKKYSVRNGDVLFNRTNSKELVGKTCVFSEDTQMIIAGYIIRVRVNSKAVPQYLSATLNSSYGKTTLFGMCKSIIGQANINAQELQDIKILIPPIELQRKFANIVASIEVRKHKLNAHLAEADHAFKSLQQSFFG